VFGGSSLNVIFVSNIKPQYFGNGTVFAFRLRGYEEISVLLGLLGGVSHTLEKSPLEWEF
jgi:hypothetical protein